jgi:drug/metabolite transporter (DMT)-like permease
MSSAVVIALLASLFTATSSICQRLGAAPAPGGDGFSVRIILYLIRQPIWLAGVLSMILGFVLQVSALRLGSLALVQPILSTELIFVFAYMALLGSRRVLRSDWLAAVAMALGLGVFLATADPSGGVLQPSPAAWWFSGLSALGLAVLVAATAYARRRRGVAPSPARKAALLGVATGISWGFLAAVIKELSSRLGDGVGAVFTSWSLYAVVVVGAASMLLLSNALQAGPLAASQPGLTIVDPLVASLLGIFLFHEHLRSGAGDLALEAVAIGVLVAGVIVLSRSRLVHGDVVEEVSSGAGVADHDIVDGPAPNPAG